MKLYNTLSGTTEPFSSSGDVVKMYVCGITPYAPTHVGHALKSVVFDVLRRYLEFQGYRVRHVENFTDVDDKMIQGAASLGTSTQELAEGNIRLYLEEMDALNVLRAHVYPRATGEIPKMLEIISALVQKGSAYAVDGDVYFRVRSHADYGKLSRRSLDSMRAGSRVEIDEKKQDVMDFSLWKRQKPGEPAWDSPWGPGRPGWHIECSAMSLSHLGAPLDIHGGGQDLVFPHHENEIAQSESYSNGGPMARFWLHNGLLRLGEDKMSKSAGNFITVTEALQRYSSDAIRLFFLSAHYRSPLTYSDDGMEGQERAVARLRNAARATGAAGGSRPLDAISYREQFISAMDDDLNTPRATAALFDLAHEINRAAADDRDVADGQEALGEMAGIVGLTLAEPFSEREADFFPLFHLLLDTDAELRAADRRDLADELRDGLGERGIDPAEVLGIGGKEPTIPAGLTGAGIAVLVDILVEARAKLRAARRYDLADKVRQRLSELGFVLKDTSRGTKWKRR